MATGSCHFMPRFFTKGWRSVSQWIASLILLPLCIQFASVDEFDILRRGVPFFFYGLLDNLTLVTHEAGHFFFQIFGRFLGIAGGSLLQLILPCILIWHFYVHDYRLGTQLSLLWLGQSFISVGIYAADARKRILPLLGDNLSGHDWHNMLAPLGLLDAAPIFGMLFYICALLCFGMLLVLPRFMWN